MNLFLEGISSDVHMQLKTLYFLFLAGESIWIVLIVLTPYVSARGYQARSEVLYYCFSFVCHQNPERSLFFWGAQVPVCARDFSLYVGALLGTAAYPRTRNIHNPAMPPAIVLGALLLPMALDGVTQFLGLRESTTLLRCITGFLAGLVVPMVILPLMAASTPSDQNTE